MYDSIKLMIVFNEKHYYSQLRRAVKKQESIRESSFLLLTNVEISLNDFEYLLALVVRQMIQIQLSTHHCRNVVSVSVNNVISIQSC